MLHTSGRWIVIWLVVSSLLAGHGEAKTYKIAAFPIPLMVEDREQGVFVELFHAVALRSGEQFEFEVYPTQRVLKLFGDGEIDGFFPGLDITAGEKSAKSSVFYTKTDFAFIRQGTPAIKTLADLEGKLVGLTKGYPYSADLLNNTNITLEYADSDVLNMKKLAKGRLDAFVVEEYSGLKALKESDVTDVVYDPQSPLSALRVFFAFQDTDEGRKLADVFSQTLTALKADGTFDKIMGVMK